MRYSQAIFFSWQFSLSMQAADLTRLFSLAAIWGGSYALMRVVAPVLGGIGTMWLRIGLAGLALWAYAAATRQDLQFRRWWKQYLVIGLLNSAIPFALIAYAMKTLPAGYGAILNASTPFFGALFAALMLKERLTPLQLLGMVLGLIGVGLIMNLGPIALDAPMLWAATASISAACLYGFVSVYTKKFAQGAPGLGTAVGSLLLPALAAAPLGLVSLPSSLPSAGVLMALVVLALVCSAIAYLLYFRLIRDVGPTKAVSVTFLIPIFGVSWGALFFGETLNAGALAGGAVVLLGVALVLGILRPHIPRAGASS